MKEVKKKNKSYILLSAIYLVIGVVMLAWPTTSVIMINKVLGLSLIVMGITYGIVFFTRDNTEHFLQIDLVIGIICLAFGVFILLNPDFLQTLLPIALGIVLLLGAVIKIQSSINMKKLHYTKWYLVLLSALVIIVLAIILLCNVIKEEHLMIVYAGICLIFDGLVNIISMLCIQFRVRKLMKVQRTHPGTTPEMLFEHSNSRPGAPEGPIVPYEDKKLPETRE